MSDRFLNTSGNSDMNLSNGSVGVYASVLGAVNLESSAPLKTNSVGQLVSSKLNIGDVVNLQTELSNTLSNPFNGTLQVTDLETADTFSLNQELAKIDNIVSATEGPDITTMKGELKIDNITNTVDDQSILIMTTGQADIQLICSDGQIALTCSDTINLNAPLTVIANATTTPAVKSISGGAVLDLVNDDASFTTSTFNVSASTEINLVAPSVLINGLPIGDTTDLETKTQNIDLATTSTETLLTANLKLGPTYNHSAIKSAVLLYQQGPTNTEGWQFQVRAPINLTRLKILKAQIISEPVGETRSITISENFNNAPSGLSLTVDITSDDGTYWYGDTGGYICTPDKLYVIRSYRWTADDKTFYQPCNFGHEIFDVVRKSSTTGDTFPTITGQHNIAPWCDFDYTVRYPEGAYTVIAQDISTGSLKVNSSIMLAQEVFLDAQEAVSKKYVDNLITQLKSNDLYLGGGNDAFGKDLYCRDVFVANNSIHMGDDWVMSIDNTSVQLTHSTGGLVDNTITLATSTSSSETVFKRIFPYLQDLVIYEDAWIRISWDSPADDLEITMLALPPGLSDGIFGGMVSSASLDCGVPVKTQLTTVGSTVDVYANGFSADNARLSVWLTANGQPTAPFPRYRLELHRVFTVIHMTIYVIL